MATIRTKRVYEQPESADGYRVLVDRLWPRGIKKEDLAIDDWAKDLAPSTELRKWFHANEQEFDEFEKRYRKELSEADEAGRSLLSDAGSGPLTLLYSSRDVEQNHAIVLAEWLGRLR